MGYTTDFSGAFKLSRNLNEVELAYINKISETRRMKRDVNKLMEIYKGEHGYPFATEQTPEAIYGRDGEYFAYEDDNDDFLYRKDGSVIDVNTPPGQIGYSEGVDFSERWIENKKREAEGICQPGLWCQWIVTDELGEGHFLIWDGGEKFYNYIEWLKYYIEHFFNKWGVMLNGEVVWQGEEMDDRGKIVVENNEVKIFVPTYVERK